MNYVRIYDQFIADRCEKESSLTVFERHHILPRSLGGTDAPANIIRLSPSDHLFAHILLARVHGGRLVWTAARMSGVEKYRGKNTRVRYAYLRNMLRPLQSERAKSLWKDPDVAERMSAHKQGNKYRVGVKPRVTQFMRQRASEHLAGNTHALGVKRSPETLEKMRQVALVQHAARKASGNTGRFKK